MKIIQTIDDHFKRNLGDDYILFYWEWILWLGLPIGSVAIFLIIFSVIRSAVSL